MLEPMRVHCLGTGDAFSGGGRGHSALLVEGGGGPRILVDCGATVPLALRRRGLMPSALEHVLVTHLHGDHAAGLAFLVLSGVYEEPGRPPLEVVGPAGTARAIDELYARLYPDVALRPRPFRLLVREVAPGDALDLAGARVEVLLARHMKPPWVAHMYRVSRGGRTIALTGDTGPAAPLEALARGADLLVCECTLPAPPDGAPPAPTASHLSTADVAAARPRWEARRVLLTHLSAPSRAEAAALPGVEVADDGLEVEP
jgi:ribonuclease BN (tRNA processing enzyme)